jgi:hypothetical protein
VKVKSLVKIADAKVNVAVAFAEAKKTSDLIFDTARRIDRAYRAFRKGDLKGIAQNLNITPKRLHKSWLEYKYGWMPLLMDVKGAAEFFAQQHVVRSPRFTVSSKETLTKSFSRNVSVAGFGGGTDFYTEHLTAFIDVKTKAWCELSSPHLTELQQIGLTNPALVAWELIPFSFVFDWFISVGDWLTGLTAMQGVTVRRAMLSLVSTYAYTLDFPETSRFQGTTLWYKSRYQMYFTIRRYIRDQWVPDPLSVHPPVTNSFNFPKLVTSLALLQGNYRGNARL